MTSPDVFTFECDLDKNLPSNERAALSVQDDGEHFVFGLEGGKALNREIYLTPDQAGDLASLLDSMLTTADEAEAEALPRGTALVANLMVVALVVGALAGLVLGVAWVISAVR